jgi:histone acetyltransferase SAS3
VLSNADCCSGMATSEEDAEFEEDDELAADPLGENSDEFAANNQLHNELGHSEDEEASEEGEEEGEGPSDEEMAENNGGEESEEEEDEEEDGEG